MPSLCYTEERKRFDSDGSIHLKEVGKCMIRFVRVLSLALSGIVLARFLGLAQSAQTDPSLQAEVWDSLREGLTVAVTRVSEFLPNLIVALVILIVGWIVAKIIGALFNRGLRRLWLRQQTDAAAQERWARVSRVSGRLAYWVVMVFVLMGFFWALQLDILVQPLNRLLEQVFTYLPQLVGAGLILLIAWLAAILLRTALTELLQRTRLSEWLQQRLDESGIEAETTSEAVPEPETGSQALGQAVFWIVLLVGLVAALNALQLSAVTDPLENMLTDFLAFVPNLVAAGLILLVGLFVIRLIRTVTANLLATTGLDSWSERIGIQRAMAGQALSQGLAWAVYVLLLIPILIAAFDALDIQAITQPAVRMLESVLTAIPLILEAALILVLAYAVARLLETGVQRILEGIDFDVLPERLGMRQSQLPREVRSPSQVVAKLALVAVMLFATMEAARAIGFSGMAELIREFIVFGANVLFALAIVGLGLYFAQLARDLVISAMGRDRGSLLSNVVRYAIIVFAIALALPRLGVPSNIVEIAFGIPLLAAAVAVAIAFGIGGRDIAARQLDSWLGSRDQDHE